MTIRDIAIAFGYELDASSEKKVNDSIKGLKNMATKALGAIGIGFSLSQANALIEQFKATNLQLKSVTGNLADQGKLQDDIMQKAASTRVSYATTAKAVSDYVSQSKKVLRTSDAALNFVELSTKAWKAAGKEESAIASLHGTLAKAFQKNIIDAGTFETLLSQSPETIKYLEKSLGKSRVQLKAMATAGVLTASQLTAAFSNSADEINAAYAETGVTISEAMQIAKDKIGLFLTQSDEGIKLTTTIAKMIVEATDKVVKLARIATNFVKDITDRLGGVENTLKLIGISVTAFLSVQTIAKVKVFIATIEELGKATIMARLKVVAIIAAIVLLLLIIEDIVGFVNGKDSLFGDLLKKAGLDVEDTRVQLSKTFDEIKTVAREAAGALKDTFGELGQALSDFWDNHGDEIVKVIVEVIQYVVSKITMFTKMLGSAIDFVCALLNGDFEGAFKAFVDLIKNSYIGKFIKDLISDVSELEIVKKIVEVIQYVVPKITMFTKMLGSAIDFVCALLNGDFKGAFKAFVNLIKNSYIGNFIKDLIGKIKELIEKIKKKFGEMKEKLKNKVAEWKDGIVEGFEAVKTWFEDLPKRAWQWGKDMLKNFVNGIKGGKGEVEDAVSDVTGPIESNLHHSVPDEGPLKDDDKWMPDFIRNLAVGIRKGLPKIRAAVQDIAAEMSVFASGAPTDITQQISQGATSTRIVNQYNNWTNNFNGGTKQEQADLADASDKQTTVASRKLGVELAYTR